MVYISCLWFLQKSYIAFLLLWREFDERREFKRSGPEFRRCSRT